MLNRDFTRKNCKNQTRPNSSHYLKGLDQMIVSDSELQYKIKNSKLYYDGVCVQSVSILSTRTTRGLDTHEPAQKRYSPAMTLQDLQYYLLLKRNEDGTL